MKLKSLHVENFQSLQSFDFDFPSGLILIDGFNYDLDSANGVGKSAILNAICYSIWGKLPKNVNSGELIRDGSDKLITAMVLVCPAGELLIERQRANKAGSLKLFLNGTQIDGIVRDLEPRIEQFLGINFDQFIQTVYIFQDASERFIDLNDTDKKRFLSMLLKLDVYDGAYKLVLAKTNTKELDYSHLDGQILAAGEQRTRLLSTHDLLVNEATEVSAAYERESTILNERTLSVKKDMSAIKAEAINLPNAEELLSKKNDLELKLNAIRKLQVMLSGAQSDKHRQEQEVERIKGILANPPNKCNTCGQDLLEFDNASFIQKHQNLLEIAQSSIQELSGKIERYQAMLNCETKMRVDYTQVIEKIGSIKKECETYNLKLAAKERELSEISREFEILNERKERIAKQIFKTEEEQKTLSVKIIELESSRSGIIEELLILGETRKVFSPTGVRAYVFGGIINQLNNGIEKYVNTLFDGTVSFSFIVDEKGRFEENLEMNGVKRSVGALSGGERRRLSLAVDLALTDTICARTSVLPNVLLLDEAGDGLDAQGKERVMELLKELSGQKDCVLIVDHSSEFKAEFTQIIKLEKRNGITRTV